MNERPLEFVVPGDLRTPTGGYRYDSRIVAGLRELGWRIRVHALDASFPFPTETALEHARSVFAAFSDGALVLVDGLAFGALSEVVTPRSSRLNLVALVHHPLAAESGLVESVVRALARSERLSLQSARHVIVTSRATQAALFKDYEVQSEKISIVEPGTDEAPLHRGSEGDDVSILCVATVTPRKGHDVLVGSLAPLAPLRWHLTCVGSTTRSPTTFDCLSTQLKGAGLMDRVTFVGEVDDASLAHYFQNADLFVSPARYEGYGMAVAEALAHGLPVIATRTGAVPDMVGPNAGLLVPPDDAGALSDALARVLRDPSLLASLARGAADARASLPRWSQACQRMSQALKGIS